MFYATLLQITLYLLLFLLSIVLFILYKNSLKSLQYWKNKNVPHPKPWPFIGNLLDLVTLRFTGGICLENLYEQFETPYFGIYIFHYPYLIIKDPELIKSMLTKDFQHFTDRLFSTDKKYDSLVSNFMFCLQYSEWKWTRSKVTPIFTITKLKKMLFLMNDVADEMIEHIEDELNKGPIDIKDICLKYSMDVIATTAFGSNGHCFKDEDSAFLAIARQTFHVSWGRFIAQTCLLLAPRAISLFNLKYFDDKVTNFIREMSWDALRKRMNSTTKRNDMIDVMKQILQENPPKDNTESERDRIIAQVGTFFSAGFETASAMMSFALYEISMQPDIQNKVREEINTVLSRYESINNEALEDMKYLHMILLETFRKYPVIQFLDRTCTKDYQISNSNVTIDKGTLLMFPLFGLHYDPQYFPNPKKFDPERFLDENESGIDKQFFYLPFGKGPRDCLGKQFAMQEMKVGLARILSAFEINKCANTPDFLKLTSKGFITASQQKIELLFKKIS
ncbi:hypothetical protein ILUMI_26860 [Ignelater luminosus]|uniref:Cytochrome P450 n=1 Tax=Ignelater luminosus TaxID=2038154 RepID=A0A8K0C3F5_IGNLU|nr:hypothetical protein ILUMI_26860 [Ignelater luminosus]